MRDVSMKVNLIPFRKTLQDDYTTSIYFICCAQCSQSFKFPGSERADLYRMASEPPVRSWFRAVSNIRSDNELFLSKYSAGMLAHIF